MPVGALDGSDSDDYDSDAPGSEANPIVAGFHLPYAIARYAINCHADGRLVRRAALRQDLALSRGVNLAKAIPRACKILQDDFGLDLKTVQLGSEQAYVVVSLLEPALQRLVAPHLPAPEAEVIGLAGICCMLIVFHGAPVSPQQITDGLQIPYGDEGAQQHADVTAKLAFLVRSRYLIENVVSDEGAPREVEYDVGARSYATFSRNSLQKLAFRTLVPSGSESDAVRKREMQEIAAVFDKSSFT